MVGRLARLGPAFRGAAKRREGAKREQDFQKREQEKREELRRAHWRAEVAGRGLRRGEFVIDVLIKTSTQPLCRLTAR